jgi:hypothetical protein
MAARERVALEQAALGGVVRRGCDRLAPPWTVGFLGYWVRRRDSRKMVSGLKTGTVAPRVGVSPDCSRTEFTMSVLPSCSFLNVSFDFL